MSAVAKKRFSIPENNPNYRGESVGVVGIHLWLRKTYGNPPFCEECGIAGQKGKRKWTISWALRRGRTYKRLRHYFWGLCDTCHRNYDKTPEWNRNISLGKRQLIEKGRL